MMCIHEIVNGFVLVVIRNNEGTYNHRVRRKKSLEKEQMEVEKSFRKHFKPICTNKSISLPNAPFMGVHSNESSCAKLTQFPYN